MRFDSVSFNHTPSNQQCQQSAISLSNATMNSVVILNKMCYVDECFQRPLHFLSDYNDMMSRSEINIKAMDVKSQKNRFVSHYFYSPLFLKMQTIQVIVHFLNHRQTQYHTLDA